MVVPRILWQVMGDPTPQLIRFLQDELAIAPEAIALGQRRRREVQGPLPIVLWQYGLLSLDQLGQTLDWLENQSVIMP